MSANAPVVPVFPLNSVLFPGGVLPLRIFETRYMDMVRDCMKSDTGFGVCLIRTGRETGKPAMPESVGCYASIADWDMRDLGVLHIRTTGGMRFRITSSHASPDGLLRAEVTWIDDDPSEPTGPEDEGCVSLLRKVIRELVEKETPLPFAEPFQFDDCAWVSNRLCEILPIPNKARQKLMELEDAPTRMSLVRQFLEHHKVL